MDGADPDARPLTIDITETRFEEMVSEALDTLPPELARMMRNVVVVVEDGTDPRLLGLYEGIPLTERLSDYSAVLPDKITIFRRAICAQCESESDVVHEVQTTVVHEIGHHFGIDDDRLHELGW
jgi:predicted Zn-dependent protease with MMP-like domain